MTIKEIQVEGLFGMFNHTIPLHEDGLTIIYGINGIGKTTIFQMLELLFKGDFVALSEIPFDSLLVEVDDETFFKIEKKVEGMIFSYYSSDFRDEFIADYDEKDLRKKLDKQFPNKFSFQGQGVYFSLYKTINEKKEWITHDDFLKYFPESLPKNLKIKGYGRRNDRKTTIHSFNDIVEKKFKEINISNIQSQRLFNIQKINIREKPHPLEERVKVLEDSVRYTRLGGLYHRSRKNELQENNIFHVINQVEQVANNISTIVKNKHEEYQELSEKLELSLGKRLIEKKVNVKFTVEELKDELEFVENKLSDLRAVGLMEGQKIEKIEIDDQIDAVTKAVIAVNIQDLKQKLTIFDKLYKELKLFQTIINKRRFSYKKMYISEEEGLIFKNYKDVLIGSDELSSGEKHELIVLYQLIFAVTEGALIFIDEPEISLHISWQKEFVNDMLEIIKLRNINIVAATHSPSIINGNWDLTVSLKGLEEETHA